MKFQALLLSSVSAFVLVSSITVAQAMETAKTLAKNPDDVTSQASAAPKATTATTATTKATEKEVKDMAGASATATTTVTSWYWPFSSTPLTKEEELKKKREDARAFAVKFEKDQGLPVKTVEMMIKCGLNPFENIGLSSRTLTENNGAKLATEKMILAVKSAFNEMRESLKQKAKMLGLETDKWYAEHSSGETTSSKVETADIFNLGDERTSGQTRIIGALQDLAAYVKEQRSRAGSVEKAPASHANLNMLIDNTAFSLFYILSCIEKNRILFSHVLKEENNFAHSQRSLETVGSDEGEKKRLESEMLKSRRLQGQYSKEINETDALFDSTVALSQHGLDVKGLLGFNSTRKNNALELNKNVSPEIVSAVWSLMSKYSISFVRTPEENAKLKELTHHFSVMAGEKNPSETDAKRTLYNSNASSTVTAGASTTPPPTVDEQIISPASASASTTTTAPAPASSSITATTGVSGSASSASSSSSSSSSSATADVTQSSLRASSAAASPAAPATGVSASSGSSSSAPATVVPQTSLSHVTPKSSASSNSTASATAQKKSLISTSAKK